MLIYNMLNMVAIYTFQIPYVKSAVPFQARQLFGLYHYSEMQISFNFIGLVVGWAATVLLFVLFAYRLRERTIIKSYPAPFQAKNPASYSSHLRTSLQKKERTAQKFLGKYGWKFCLLALLLVTLLVPSVLGMILLLAVFVGAVVPHERLERVKFIPALLCYFTLWLIAQYIFNLSVDYGAVSCLTRRPIVLTLPSARLRARHWPRQVRCSMAVDWRAVLGHLHSLADVVSPQRVPQGVQERPRQVAARLVSNAIFV